MTPPSASRSVTQSPPRTMLTTEQRELKRQRDIARRDSKVAARARRAGSGSSYTHSPPSNMADLASPHGMPVYTTAPAQISLLAEPTTMAPSPYMPSYTPPMADQSQPIFPSPYQQQYMPDYSSQYSLAPQGIPPQYRSVPNMNSQRINSN